MIVASFAGSTNFISNIRQQSVWLASKCSRISKRVFRIAF